jgi:hypothetical protein
VGTPPLKERHMLNPKLHAPAPSRVEIDASQDLLAALQKISSVAVLSNAERFEIAALTFMVARALCRNERARSS